MKGLTSKQNKLWIKYQGTDYDDQIDTILEVDFSDDFVVALFRDNNKYYGIIAFDDTTQLYVESQIDSSPDYLTDAFDHLVSGEYKSLSDIQKNGNYIESEYNVEIVL